MEAKAAPLRLPVPTCQRIFWSQKLMPNLSGNNNTDTDHFNSIMNMPSNQNDIMEFEFFMNGIQSKLKEKEEKRLVWISISK